MIENTEYVYKFADDIGGQASYNAPYLIAVFRAFIPMHPFWGAMTASYLVGRGEPAWIRCVWRSILLHGSYDFLAFFGSYAKNRNCPSLSNYSFSMIMAVILISFCLTWEALKPLTRLDANNIGVVNADRDV